MAEYIICPKNPENQPAKNFFSFLWPILIFSLYLSTICILNIKKRCHEIHVGYLFSSLNVNWFNKKYLIINFCNAYGDKLICFFYERGKLFFLVFEYL